MSFSVNNCVGLLNYRYFCNFLLSCSLLCLIGFIGSGLAAYFRWEMYKEETGLFIAYNVPSFFIGLVAFLLLLTLFPFWCYHCGLSMRKTTTREHVDQ